MKIEDLNKAYYIKLEIENIKKIIENLPMVKSIDYSGMPHGTGVSNPVESRYLQEEKLKERLKKKEAYYEAELDKIEKYINKIEDVNILAMARMRFMMHMKWEDIAQEMHYDRTVCYRKLKSYLNKMNREL